MSALDNHAFAKMNGIGNEIVVVDLRDSDLRGSKATVTAEEARAVACHMRVPGSGHTRATTAMSA